MKCATTKPWHDPMPDELEDKGLVNYPNHTMLTHLGCVLIRTCMGVALTNPTLSHKARTRIIFIMLMAIFVFGMKYINKIVLEGNLMWKFYPRMIAIYSVALYLILKKRESLAGILVIVDAMIGFQTRHTSSVVTLGLGQGQKKMKCSL